MTDLAHQWCRQEFLKKGLGAHSGIVVPLDSLSELLSHVDALTKERDDLLQRERKDFIQAQQERDAWKEYVGKLKAAVIRVHSYHGMGRYCELCEALALPQPGVKG